MLRDKYFNIGICIAKFQKSGILESDLALAILFGICVKIRQKFAKFEWFFQFFAVISVS